MAELEVPGLMYRYPDLVGRASLGNIPVGDLEMEINGGRT